MRFTQRFALSLTQSGVAAHRRLAVLPTVAGACLCVMAQLGAAQSYPQRAIRMVVALGPGGGTDVTGRIVSQKLAEQMGVPVVVENRPGAGTVIGHDLVAKAVPDGYTLIATSPEILTVVESGVPGFEVTGWYMMLAPAALPREIVVKLNGEIVKAVHSPSVKERFAALGTEPVGSSPEACGEFLRNEIAKWTKVVRAAGAKAD